MSITADIRKQSVLVFLTSFNKSFNTPRHWYETIKLAYYGVTTREEKCWCWRD